VNAHTKSDIEYLVDDLLAAYDRAEVLQDAAGITKDDRADLRQMQKQIMGWTTRLESWAGRPDAAPASKKGAKR
jgi:hypothetical protein